MHIQNKYNGRKQDLTHRVGQFCRQQYWEQYIGPILARIPIFLLVLLLVVIYIFSLLIIVTVLLLLVSKIKNIGFFIDYIWYCIVLGRKERQGEVKRQFQKMTPPSSEDQSAHTQQNREIQKVDGSLSKYADINSI